LLHFQKQSSVKDIPQLLLRLVSG
jgi:hypothetical protein